MARMKMESSSPPDRPVARHHTMDLRLRSVHQLFNSMDPSPFVERDLDADAEEFIVSWARELPRQGGFRLVIHLDDYPDEPEGAGRVATAVHHYFAYRAQVTAREFKLLMREGRLSLLIGLAFLGACLFAARLIGGWAAGHPLAEFAGESLVIGGWVAMWRPMQIFLYDWWPLARHRRILSRLARMEVELRRAGTESAPASS